MRRCFIIICLLFSFNLYAAIEYDEERNIIRVTDFPEDIPCTLKKLWKTDGKRGWNRIKYDQQSDTYTINANLWIGGDDGSSTYFVIGDEKHPEVTLIVNGNLVLYPSLPKGEKKGKSVNRLTIGNAENNYIKPMIKIGGANVKGQRYGMYAGTVPGKGLEGRGYSGELLIYGASFAPYGESPEDLVWGIFEFRAKKIRLFNSRLIKLRGGVVGIAGASYDHILKNTVFENCGTGLSGFWDNFRRTKPVVGCTFKNCGTAINVPSYDPVFVNCSFEDNRHNWVYRNIDTMELIDCEIQAPAKGDICKITTAKYSVKQKWKSQVISKKHVIIQTVDSEGKPVAGVTVNITGGSGNEKLLFTTGTDGKTPGEGSIDAVLLEEFIMTATADPKMPTVRKAKYDIVVQSDGRKGEVRGYAPRKCWEILRITVK